MNVIDLFAGPGGWDVAARQLGLDPLGIEWDDAACATRKAAGLRTEQADVAALNPADFAPIGLLIASPPCQDFSMAGKRAGIDGDRGKLVREVPRWAEALRPTFIVCEQVPPVLEIWQHFAHVFRTWGYSAWTGVLNAADYGVPQTRQRAILIARRDGLPAVPPEPTHCRGGAPESMFGPGLKPWVSMAQALGWGLTERPGYTFAPGTKSGGASLDGGGSGARAAMQNARDRGAWEIRRGYGEGMTERHGERPGRSSDEPSFVVDSKARSWTLHTNRDQQPDGSRQTVSADQPAPSFTAKSGGQWVRDRFDPELVASGEWVQHGPATTVCGDPRIFAPGGHHTPGAQSQNAIRITVEEAAALQSFPPDYPWQGSRTKQFEQIGNAVPPRLAAHVLAAVLDLELEVAA